MGNVIFDLAGKDDISELVRLRIAYMIDFKATEVNSFAW